MQGNPNKAIDRGSCAGKIATLWARANVLTGRHSAQDLERRPERHRVREGILAYCTSRGGKYWEVLSASLSGQLLPEPAF